jgi:hypothetical protein
MLRKSSELQLKTKKVMFNLKTVFNVTTALKTELIKGVQSNSSL